MPQYKAYLGLYMWPQCYLKCCVAPYGNSSSKKKELIMKINQRNDEESKGVIYLLPSTAVGILKTIGKNYVTSKFCEYGRDVLCIQVEIQHHR